MAVEDLTSGPHVRMKITPPTDLSSFLFNLCSVCLVRILPKDYTYIKI